jgi:hypothetical protein
MIPVGNTIPQPQPINALGALSGILGIKQQQQNLQTGQYVQQQEQSGAQQQQQAMNERLAVQKMMTTGIDDQGNNVKDANGEPDPAKVLPALGRMAPLTGQQYAQSILKTATDKVGLQTAATNLDVSQRGLLSGVIQAGSLSGAKSPEINAGIDNLVQAHPEMGNAAGFAKDLVSHLDNVQDPDKRKQLANKISAYLQAGQPVGTQPANAAVNTGKTQFQGVAAPAAAGGGFTATTQVGNEPGPTDTPQFRAAVQAATTAAGGAAGTDVARANQVSTAIQPSQAMIPITKEIDSLTDQIHSGKFAGAISQAAAAVGMKADTYARQLLVKDLGQVRGAATRNAPSDEMANTILSGYPEATSDPQTIHTSMDLVRGQFRQNMERGQLLIQHRQQRPDLQGFAQADDRFTSTNTPYMSEFRSLPPDQRTAFYGRHFKTPQEAQAFKNAALQQ